MATVKFTNSPEWSRADSCPSEVEVSAEDMAQ
jgi:hypothetical protein